MTEPTQFFDINQLPQEEGIILMGISMSRIGNNQSADKCLEYIKHLGQKITKTDGIGAVFLYSDYLYFHSAEPASLLRDRYKELMLAHKNGFLRALLSDDKSWIKKAFSFYTFGQIMLDNSEVYTKTLSEVRRLYETNSDFKRAVDTDAENVGKGVSELGVMFILEEITLFYLSAKGQLSFNNRFVSGTEQWILQCYPGKPLKSEIYLFQQNPLKLSNPKNRFEDNFYDLEGRKLYKYSDIDVQTLNH